MVLRDTDDWWRGWGPASCTRRRLGRSRRRWPELSAERRPPLSDEEAVKDSSGSEPSHSPSPEEDDNDDDPQTKKRKRKMRNRDAAVRSRERKKMYVKDLEMKSRYFESECKRLGMGLQCVMAENHSLRLAMYNN